MSQHHYESRLQVNVDRELRKQLKTRSLIEEVTQGWIIERALTEYFENHPIGEIEEEE